MELEKCNKKLGVALQESEDAQKMHAHLKEQLTAQDGTAKVCERERACV